MQLFNYLGLFILIAYVALLLIIGYYTSGKTQSNSTFFTSDRSAPWLLVAVGMVGASLSGVTFISIPGEVGSTYFYYFQIVMGYMVGYAIIAFVLIPLYYQLKLVSIYEYLEHRFGHVSQKSGSALFLISQAIGASLRLLIVALVLQSAIFEPLGIPFYLSVLGILFLIWLYTRRGGIKTIVYTDVLQTFFILLALIATFLYIVNFLDQDTQGVIDLVLNHPQAKIFDWKIESGSYFLKHFVSGILIALVMTGLDQNMMQKSLACNSVHEAQKNVFLFSFCLLLTNFIFLILGFFIYRYAEVTGVELFDSTGKVLVDTDEVYGKVAMEFAPEWIGILFLLGVIAASFSSADSSLTSLTTSLYRDFFKISEDRENNMLLRKGIHVVVTGVVYIIVLVLYTIKSDSVINYVLLFAGYTYGPLLGLFSFGIITKYEFNEKWLPIICVLAPLLTYCLYLIGQENGFELGFLVLLVNGLLTFMMLFLLKINNKSKKKTKRVIL